MSRHLLVLAALLGLLAVAAGAMGSHALKGLLDPRQLGWYRTAAEYQMYHALALLGLAVWLDGRPFSPAARLSAGGFLLGILLFCGSLYALALGGGLWLAHITPFGGLALLLGWAALAWAAWRDRRN